MILVSDIINRVRILLKDQEPYRWEDLELLAHVDDGQVEIYRRRPDAFYTDEVVTEAPGRVTSTDQELNLDRQYISCIVDWVTHRALLKDAEEANLARSANHYNLFIKHLS